MNAIANNAGNEVDQRNKISLAPFAVTQYAHAMDANKHQQNTFAAAAAGVVLRGN